MFASLILTASTAMGGSAAAAPTGMVKAVPEPLRVAVYGDSIAVEVRPYLARLAGRGVVFDWNVFGGTNACDFLAEARKDARGFRPTMVLTLFTGNDFTSCMKPQGRTLSNNEVAWKTAADTNALAAMFPKANVVRIGFARSRDQQIVLDAGGAARIDAVGMFLERSSTTRLHYLPTAAVLLDRRGRYADVLPCTSAETAVCRNGAVRVRSSDGMHLCPVAPKAVQGVLPECGGHSPGAERVARVIVRGVFGR